MKQASRTSFGLGLAAALFLAGTAAAAADSFGAISYSPSTGAHGWSFDFGSRWQAEEEAQRQCIKHARDCRIATWFKNACGALATGPNGWGAHWGNTRSDAEYAAISACGQHSGGCQVIRWQCSGAR